MPAAWAWRNQAPSHPLVRSPISRACDTDVSMIGDSLKFICSMNLPWRPGPSYDGQGVILFQGRRIADAVGVETPGELDVDSSVERDLAYIDRWSLLLDLRILVKTVPAVLLRTGR